MPDTHEKVCCFTGFRPHRFRFSPDGLRPEHVRRALGEQIDALYAQGYRTFISGMCVGVDLWAAAEVLRLRRTDSQVTLVAAVPFRGQESHWPIPTRQEYRQILDACDRVEYLFDEQQAERDAAACYRARNVWMVDHADTVLAVYTADGVDRRSGTAATVRYAKKMMRRILYIHPETLATAEETVHQLQFPL